MGDVDFCERSDGVDDRVVDGRHRGELNGDRIGIDNGQFVLPAFDRRDEGVEKTQDGDQGGHCGPHSERGEQTSSRSSQRVAHWKPGQGPAARRGSSQSWCAASGAVEGMKRLDGLQSKNATSCQNTRDEGNGEADHRGLSEDAGLERCQPDRHRQHLEEQ